MEYLLRETVGTKRGMMVWKHGAEIEFMTYITKQDGGAEKCRHMEHKNKMPYLVMHANVLFWSLCGND